MSRSLIQQTVREAAAGAAGVAALWHGEIVEVLANGTVWVLVPRLGGTDPFGPVIAIPVDLARGERVLVGAVEGLIDELIVIQRFDVSSGGGGTPPAPEAIDGGDADSTYVTVIDGGGAA